MHGMRVGIHRNPGQQRGTQLLWEKNGNQKVDQYKSGDK